MSISSAVFQTVYWTARHPVGEDDILVSNSKVSNSEVSNIVRSNSEVSNSEGSIAEDSFWTGRLQLKLHCTALH